jgi:hypothetical protein
MTQATQNAALSEKKEARRDRRASAVYPSFT